MYNYNKVYCVKILATSDKNVQSYLDIKSVRPKTFFSWSIRNSFIYRKCSYKSPIFINYILFYIQFRMLDNFDKEKDQK